MASETQLDEAVKKALIDRMLLGKDMVLSIKRWGVRELEEVEGRITNFVPRGFIEFTNPKGEPEYRHFCGPYYGIRTIIERVNDLFYVNMRVDIVDKMGYSQNRPFNDEARRKEILDGGSFLLHPELLPVEIYF